MGAAGNDETAAKKSEPQSTDSILSAATGSKKEAELLEELQKACESVNESRKNNGSDLNLDALLGVEKRARLAGEVAVVVKAANAVVEACREATAWEELNRMVALLCKRRHQFRQVQSKVVVTCAQYVDEMEASGVHRATRRSLIEALRNVSEGKLFVEVERARLTMKLAQMEEADGNVAEAATILQEEQVETYGAMTKREKYNFILEQMRLCLAKKDYVRAYIIAKKIATSSLEEARMEDLKIRYYELMIRYYTVERDALELAKAHAEIYNSEGVRADEAKWKEALSSTALYIALSPFDNHQMDMLHRTIKDKRLPQLPVYHELLLLFRRREIIQWPLANQEALFGHAVLSGMNEDGELDWKTTLHDRVVEHNIRVVAEYFSSIKVSRLATFLQLPDDETERYVSQMVTSKLMPLFARIDRPAGVISFTPQKSANDHLTEWAGDISTLLNLVEKTCHVIDKEETMHKVGR